MISPKQKKILAFPYSRYDALICDGAVRSGKTSIMTWAFIKWAMENFSGQRFGICAKTVGSAKKNIVVPFMAMTLAKERYTMRWHQSSNELEVQRGYSKNVFELFGGKDESSFALIQGRTLAGILLDEVVLMPESFVNQALARCSVDGAKLWFSCNPGAPSHWFHEEWIKRHDEHNALYLHFSMKDNPGLSQKTIEFYKSMYPPGVFYDRYVLGMWVLAEGLIYPMYQEAIEEPPDKEPMQYVLSIDYGTQNAFAGLLWGKIDDVWYALKEYYYSGRDTGIQKTDEEYAKDLDKFIELIMTAREERTRYVERMRTIIDPSAASFITLLRKRKWYNVISADNAVADGIRETATAMKKGSIKISPECKNLIKEMQGYIWDDSTEDDRPVKENDHCLAGDTLVHTLFGKRKIKDLRFGLLWSYDGKKKVIRPFCGCRKTMKNQKIYRIRTEKGDIRCTGNHRILTTRGWIRAARLKVDDEVVKI